MSSELQKYLRSSKFPHIWCAGCGNGIVLQALIRAIDRIGLDQNKVCLVSGIGCSSRLPGYMDFNTLHTAHGRAIAFATGIKMAKPELVVFVITGDGDATAIGGNHYIHAARRNIDLNVILINNGIYGMTGGQVSPTTPMGSRATTAPYGQTEHSFNIAGLAEAAGATFVARTTSYHATDCERFIRRSVENKGFSVVEVIAACPTAYGRLNRMPDPVDMLIQQKECAVPIQKARSMSKEELEGKIVTGVFIDTPRPECREEYQKLIERFMTEAKP